MIHSWLKRVQDTRQRNKGSDIGAWPARLQTAWALFRQVLPEDKPAREVADYGCGRQQLKTLLPAGWSYVPYDWTPRSPDTRVCDLAVAAPTGTHEIIFMLGVLEYMPDPARLLSHALNQARWTVFSCFCGWSPLRAWKQGWRGRLSRRAVERVLQGANVQVRAYQDWRGDGGLWVCENLDHPTGGKGT